MHIGTSGHNIVFPYARTHTHTHTHTPTAHNHKHARRTHHEPWPVAYFIHLTSTQASLWQTHTHTRAHTRTHTHAHTRTHTHTQLTCGLCAASLMISRVCMGVSLVRRCPGTVAHISGGMNTGLEEEGPTLMQGRLGKRRGRPVLCALTRVVCINACCA